MEIREEEGGSASPQLAGGEEEEGREPSPEDLKAQLYRSLQAKGVLSQLKSQLRCRLVQELRGSSRDAATPPVPLALQVANSVVAEHLRVCGYQYTLSTFLPESHSYLDRLLSREDILHYLHLQPPAPLHSALTNNTGKGLLRDLLDSLIAVPVGGASRDHAHSVGVQTEGGRVGGGGGGVLTLVERLRALDEDHMARLAEEEGEEGDGEERWRRECEELVRNKMEKEMEQFRETELAKVREEERRHCDAESRNQRLEQEEAHRKKMESLRRLELDTLNSLRSRQLESEAALFSRRQELELQLQDVGAREDQLRRETEARVQTLSLVEQRLSVATEQLGAREREVVAYRERMEAVVRGEFAAWETKLNSEQGRQDAVRVELEEARAAMKEERRRREELEAALHEASKQVVELQKQQEGSLRALEKVSDHGAIRQELVEVRAALVRAERRLSENRVEHRRLQAEQQEIIRGLRRQLGRPTGERGREEGERVMRELLAKLSEAEEEKKQLRQEIARQAALVGRQRGQLEEQALGLREMEREVRDLSSQLATWQTSVLHSRYSTARSVGTHGAPAHTSIVPPHLPTPSPPHLPHSPHSLSSPLQETRAAFHQLEQQTAEQLEKHFHQLLLPHSLTHSPPHTPSITTAPLTTCTKTTPTYQITKTPKTMPTSLPTKTTPILHPSKATPALSANFVLPETTPTTSIAPPRATPTTSVAPPNTASDAVPRPSLDHLWRTSSSQQATLSSSPALQTALSYSAPLTSSPAQAATLLPNLLSSSFTHSTASLFSPATTPAPNTTSAPPTNTLFSPAATPAPNTTSAPPTASLFSPAATPAPNTTSAPPTASLFSPGTTPAPNTTSAPPTASLFSPAATPAPNTTSAPPTNTLFSAQPATSVSSTVPMTSIDPMKYSAPPTATYTPQGTTSAAPPTTTTWTAPLPSPTVSLALTPPTPPSYVEGGATQTRGTEVVTSADGQEEGVDPLMMKYMELVRQRRAGEETSRHAPSLLEHSQVPNEVRSLSQATDSFGGMSEGDQSSSRDPFQDW